ncbi:unnamed protein product, partial [Phytomonas sp. Hart1]
MILGKFTANVQRLRGLLRIVFALTPRFTATKRFIEAARILCDGLFLLWDNLALLGGARLLGHGISPAASMRRAKRWQLAGYLLAALVDLFDLRDGLERLRYDPPAAQRAITNASLRFLQDATDVTANCIALGGLGGIARPTDRVVGILTCLAAALGAITYWREMKE